MSTLLYLSTDLQAISCEFAGALRFQKVPNSCDLKSLQLRFAMWASRTEVLYPAPSGPVSDRLPAAALETTLCVFRCSVGVCVDAFLAILYGMVYAKSCRSCCPALFFDHRVGQVSEVPFRGPSYLVFLLNALAFWGRLPWWGDACVSRYHGPSRRLLEREGRPMAPPPLVFLILLAGLLSLVGVGKIGSVFGSCLGILGNQICVCFCRPSELSPCLSGMSASSASSFSFPFPSGGWGASSQ